MPWLPPDAVTTCSGRGPAASAFTAPRSLNDPPRCRCSSLSTSGRPSTSARSTGVRRTCGATAAAASATEAAVGSVVVTPPVYLTRREDAELVPLDVGHDRPPRLLVEDGRPARDDLRHVADDVEVHPVLPGLRLGHRGDVQRLEGRAGDVGDVHELLALVDVPPPVAARLTGFAINRRSVEGLRLPATSQQLGPPPADAARIGRVEAHLVQPVRRRLRAHESAELAALGIRHDGPPRLLVDDRRAEGEQLVDGARMDVEVHSILHGLRLGHRVDPHRVLRLTGRAGPRPPRRRRRAPARAPPPRTCRGGAGRRRRGRDPCMRPVPSPKRRKSSAGVSIHADAARVGAEGPTRRPSTTGGSDGPLPAQRLHPRRRHPAQPRGARGDHEDVDDFHQELRDAGAWVFSGGLEAPDTATVVRAPGRRGADDRRPFAEAKEYLGGSEHRRRARPRRRAGVGPQGGAGDRRCPIEVRPFDWA